MKLAHKISFSFFVVTLVIITIAVAFLYTTSRNTLLKTIYYNLNTTVESRANLIELYLKMIKSATTQTTRSVEFPALLRMPKEDPQYAETLDAAVKLLRSKKRIETSIYEYLIIDTTGQVVASTDTNSIGEDKSADASFLGAQKEVYIKDAYYSKTSKAPLMAISAPLFDSTDGAFLGVLVAKVKLDELYSIVADKTGLGETGEIYILNKYGYMITPSRFKEDTFLKQKTAIEASCVSCHAEMANAGRILWNNDNKEVPDVHKMGHVFPNYIGKQVVGAYKYIPQMQWSVLGEINEKEVFAPLVLIRRFFIIVLLSAPILAWLLGILIAGSITRPLYKLYKGTELIGSGKLDYKVGTNAKDEVGQLSRAFDTMAENLRNTTTSVESLNKEIAERKKAEKALEIRNTELERINKIVIGRELRMIELKKEIEELKKKT